MQRIYEENGEYEVFFDESKRDWVVDRLVQWYINKKSFAGEVIMQSDDCVIGAPELLSEIAEEVFLEVFDD